MLYRVRADLAFTDKTKADGLRKALTSRFPDAVTINPGQYSEELGYITLEECYHDEDPTKPCNLTYTRLTQ